jgi:glycosyltransferase involved in cell wall biosynthesis
MKDRILLLIKGLGRGGAEQILASSIPYLDRERFDHEVAYLLPWKDALVKEIADHGVPVHCLGGGRGFGWIPRLRALARERGIDLIHAQSPVAAAGARLAFPGRRRPRSVYTEHNVWERYHSATYWANLTTFPRNDHVFAVSEHVRRSIAYPAPLRGLPMPPVETRYHGIDVEAVRGWAHVDGVRDELGIPPEAPVVGTVANLKGHKRLDRLLRAAAIVRRSHPDVRFVLVGSGPREADLRRLATKLHLDGTVSFLGFREDAQRVTASFDVFALSSEHEGLSIALIEALALGRPAVVPDVGGLGEVVRHDREGLLVPAGDEGALAAAIVRLLGDGDLRRRLGATGRVRAEDFDIRVAVARIEAVYGELLR